MEANIFMSAFGSSLDLVTMATCILCCFFISYLLMFSHNMYSSGVILIYSLVVVLCIHFIVYSGSIKLNWNGVGSEITAVIGLTFASILLFCGFLHKCAVKRAREIYLQFVAKYDKGKIASLDSKEVKEMQDFIKQDMFFYIVTGGYIDTSRVVRLMVRFGWCVIFLNVCYLVGSEWLT